MAAMNKLAQKSRQALLYKCSCYRGKTPILFLIHNYFSLFIPGKGKNISCKHNNGDCKQNSTECQDRLYCSCYLGLNPILFSIHIYFSLFIPGKGKNISCKHNNGGCEHNCTEVQDGLYCSCFPGFQANKQDLTTCEGVLVSFYSFLLCPTSFGAHALFLVRTCVSVILGLLCTHCFLGT